MHTDYGGCRRKFGVHCLLLLGIAASLVISYMLVVCAGKLRHVTIPAAVPGNLQLSAYQAMRLNQIIVR